MSKRNSLKRRKAHHAYLLRYHKTLAEKEKQKREIAKVRKEQNAVVSQLANALTIGEKTEKVALAVEEPDAKEEEEMADVEDSDAMSKLMKPRRVIRKSKKDRRRLRKMKARLEATGKMVLD